MTKVLLVEDSTIVAFHIKLFLQSNGFQVVQTINRAEDVVNSIQENSADIILMDIMLDGEMSGIDASIEVRKFSNIPIIFMSALSDTESITTIKSIPNVAVVGKPFEDQQLLNTIWQMMLNNK